MSTLAEQPSTLSAAVEVPSPPETTPTTRTYPVGPLAAAAAVGAAAAVAVSIWLTNVMVILPTFHSM